MSKRGLGKALEDALQGKEEKRPKKGIKSVLSSPVRRQIYQYLTLHPGAYLSLISKDLLISIHTLEWHLNKLRAADYIEEERIGGYRIYFPTHLVDKNEIMPLHLLHRENHRLIFSCILHHPGMSMKECSENCGLSVSSAVTAIKDLKTENLITAVEDGRFRRYFPSDRLQELITYGKERQESFLKWLMERLHEEGLEPEIDRREEGIAQITIKSMSGTSGITVGLNPWSTVLKIL